jgi:hypothetical protein
MQFTAAPWTAPLNADEILAIQAFPEPHTRLLAVTAQQALWQFELGAVQAQPLMHLPDLGLSQETEVQIKVSPDTRFAAITRIDRAAKNNRGVVVDLTQRCVVMDLPGFDYHPTEAPFPVAFFQHQGKILLVMATDWAQLDLVDLATGQCLSTREESDINDTMREGAVFTEWAGELVVSPDGQRIATVGWAWHPAGLAWTFSLADWLNNRWEPDFGRSKRLLGEAWSYFWFSPLAWLDDQRLIIWGDPSTQDADDRPANNVVIYDAVSGERIGGFDGPLLGTFEVHGPWLFSTQSNEEGGLIAWDWASGQNVASWPGRGRAIAYVAAQRSFLLQDEEGQWQTLTWSTEATPLAPGEGVS